MVSGVVDVGNGFESVILGLEYLLCSKFVVQQGELKINVQKKEVKKVEKVEVGKIFKVLVWFVVIDWFVGIKGCLFSKNYCKCKFLNDCIVWVGLFEFEGYCDKVWFWCDCWIQYRIIGIM